MTEQITKVVKTSKRGSRPGERRGGRQKGVPNKINADLKGMILGALQAVNGEEYLRRVAEVDPRTFCALLGRVLPMTIANADDKGFIVKVITNVPRPGDDG